MTDEGPVLVPVFVPVTFARRCSVPTISRHGATENEMLAAVVNRAAECAVLEVATKPEQRKGEVH
jgi:hypothetical protein